MIARPDNHTIVIFGASGDLSSRKLVPSLFSLFRQGLMPQCFAILGVSRTQFSDSMFRDKAREALVPEFTKGGDSDSILKDFLAHLCYLSLDTNDPAQYVRLKEEVDELERSCGTHGNLLFYFATPPSSYETIAEGIASTGLQSGPGNRKIVVEKPFGYDLASARELNRKLHEDYEEEQIFRIDHYLGKETVQNILVMRFANGIFEPLWNRNYIDYVEITAAESIGIEHRGGYYEGSGAFRDMVQNHLLQVAGLVAMEPPIVSDATAIRNETLKVFQALRPLSDDDLRNHVIRGQYLSSMIRGERVLAYREEPGVKPHSRTETYAALKFFIDNWRWSGVPFVLRTGKRLPTRVTEVVIHFKPTPHRIFHHEDGLLNEFILRIQPDEGVLLKFGMKVPGHGFEVKTVGLDVRYAELDSRELPTAYERLLLNCLQGDSTLFLRADAVEETWKFVTPILEYFQSAPELPLYGYPAGSWGPDAADALVGGNGWRYPCKNLAEDGLFCEL